MKTPVDSDTITRGILRVIGATATLDVDPASLGDQDDLYDAGLKSIAAVHVMLGLEDEFGIEFPDTALNRSAFATVERIRSMISGLLQHAPSAAAH